MLTLLIIFALAAVVSAAALFLRRTKRPPEMLGQRPLPGAEAFRPLFEPSAADLAAAEHEQHLLRSAEEQRVLERSERAAASRIEQVLASWRSAPVRAKTIGLLSDAAKDENEDIYIKVCKEILRVWRNGSVRDISADDLALMMESHYWLIPADKRTPGAGFLLKEETAGLRRGPLNQN